MFTHKATGQQHKPASGLIGWYKALNKSPQRGMEENKHREQLESHSQLM